MNDDFFNHKNFEIKKSDIAKNSINSIGHIDLDKLKDSSILLSPQIEENDNQI